MQDFNKVFKTPKYTGVTLSLLSMFVLASMLVVWNKLSESPEVKNQQILQVICEKKLQPIFRNAIQSFYKETGIGCTTAFLTIEEISDFLLNKKDAQSSIMLIVTGSEPSIVNLQSEKFIERFVLGNCTNIENSPVNKNPTLPAICLIGKDITKSWNALAIIRFLTAPNRDHIFPDKDSFIPFVGDPWQPTQTINLYANPEIKEKLSHATDAFSNREGIKIESNFKKLSNTNETISIIAKSNATQYLPDIIIGHQYFEDPGGLYSKQYLSTKELPYYISKTSKSSNSVKRLLQTIQKFF